MVLAIKNELARMRGETLSAVPSELLKPAVRTVVEEHTAIQKKASTPAEGDGVRVWQMLTARGMSVKQLCDETGWMTGRVNAALDDLDPYLRWDRGTAFTK